jgi:hypothetical protein
MRGTTAKAIPTMTFGDPEGHSEASRRGWGEDESRSRGSASRYRSRGRYD